MIISYIIIILLTPFLILLNFQTLVFNQNYYQKEFTKLGVESQIKGKELINYLCCIDSIDQKFFTERERQHLVDVKSLIKLSQIQLLLITAVLAFCTLSLITRKKFKLLINSLVWGPILTILSIFTLWITSLVNFDLAFLKYHQLLFRNDLWLLPEDSNLIKLFPPEFFADFANRIAYQTIIVSFTIFIIFFTFKKFLILKS